MNITAKIDMKLKCFIVPNSICEDLPPVPSEPVFFVVGHEPVTLPRTFKLSEIPAETLYELCEEFKTEIFKRAGKSVPPSLGISTSGA